MKEREQEIHQKSLRELIAYMITRKWEPGLWRGLVYSLIAGTV